MSNDKIQVLSTEKRTFPPSKEFSQKAHIKSMEEYEKLYKQSVDEPGEVLGRAGREEPDVVQEVGQGPGLRFPQALHQVVHRRQAERVGATASTGIINTPTRNKAAIIWEADGGEYKTYTYQQLYMEVNRFANVLKKKGVKKGDRVTIYLPMIPELAISMLACARIGAIHSIVFGGFSAKSLMDRIQDCQSQHAHHRRRRRARRPVRAAQGQRRRGPERVPDGQERHRRSARRHGQGQHGAGPGHLVARRDEGHGHRELTASPSRWTPRTRSSSSTPPARPASPRACSTPRPATCCTPT